MMMICNSVSYDRICGYRDSMMMICRYDIPVSRYSANMVMICRYHIPVSRYSANMVMICNSAI